MRALPISGEYPPDWKVISDATWAAAGHRCIRCAHPYRKGENGKGQWSACDDKCRHGGPFGLMRNNHEGELVFLPLPDCQDSEHAAQAARQFIQPAVVVAEWRIGTVHHLDGNKANCEWWNLLALCQRCHLTIQSRVNPQIPYFLSHSDWFKPYVAAFYAWKYEGKLVTRDEAVTRMEQLLAYELVA